MKKLIFILFAILIFFVPLILWPYTSEVFEFNKMVLVYILTVLITAAWLTRSLLAKRFIFRRTILDIPLVVFFGSQLISTILSIDFYTSVFGYYSRFNGGLLSTVCYLLLYWAFVSNFDAKETLRLIKIWFASAVLVSFYGVAEHFGIDKNIWVQDVASRVFSTLGQPNWLAAWVTALIPLAWASAIYNLQFTRQKFSTSLIYFSISVLLFITLLFTKSRSGLAGFLVADVIFWAGYFWLVFKKDLRKFFILFGICHLMFGLLALLIGTQWTPSLSSMLKRQLTVNSEQLTVAPAGTALETGGTESGTIRKIVWQGALELWLHYPVFGTGVESFAYSYYLYRPVAHNLTSEWDFIYNKAHNEFLNFAANSGTIGLISYLIVIGFSIFIFVQKLEFPISNFQFPIKSKSKNSQIENSKPTGNWQLETGNWRLALLAGFISLSVSNFFGFSVVPTQLEFFLFPALAVAIANNQQPTYDNQHKKLTGSQNILMLIVVSCMLYVVFGIAKYWYADILYAQGKNWNNASRPDLAIPVLAQAIKLEPSQAIYYAEIANSYTVAAMAYSQNKDATTTAELTNMAIATIQNAVTISPANVNLRRTMFAVFVRLSTIDEKYLANAKSTITATIKLAPTDAKLFYNLGVIDANLGDFQAAAVDLAQAVSLKADYGNARIEYAAVLVHLKRNDEAKVQLNYILTNIDPNNATAKQALANIR